MKTPLPGMGAVFFKKVDIIVFVQFSSIPKAINYKSLNGLAFQFIGLSRRGAYLSWPSKVYMTEGGLRIGKLIRRQIKFSQILHATSEKEWWAHAASLLLNNSRKYYFVFFRMEQKE